MKVSILIPVLNKWNFTKSCLNDLSHLNPKDEIEIMVIDNGSTDETPKELACIKESMTNLVTIRSDENLGFGKGLNLLYEKAKGDVVIFLNNDIRVEKNKEGWIHSIYEGCDDNSIVSPSGGFVDPKDSYHFKWHSSDPAKLHKMNYMSGWCLAAKKAVFDKLVVDSNEYKGPFDEIFGKAYYEDTNLSFAAKKMGMKFNLVPVPVHHFGQVSAKQLNLNGLYNKTRQIFADRWTSV